MSCRVVGGYVDKIHNRRGRDYVVNNVRVR